MGILIDAPQDKARWEHDNRKAKLADEREYGFTKGYSDGFAKGFAEGRVEALARVRSEDWHRRTQERYRRYKDS